VKLSDVWMIFVCLALTMYVVLDGYDLGIGVLTLLDRDERRRREMHELVSWYWDGNESWLVFLALTVWSGLPLVLGIALPALYVPLILMLWSLIARGVALEMIEQHKGWHPFWGKVFGVGSLLAAFCQGAAFGGVVAGFNVNGSDFVGGPFTFLHHGYAVLTGLTAVALYLLAGCAFLYRKSDGATQLRAARTGRLAAVALAVGTAASWLLASSAGPVVRAPARVCRSGSSAGWCSARGWHSPCAPSPRTPELVTRMRRRGSRRWPSTAVGCWSRSACSIRTWCPRTSPCTRRPRHTPRCCSRRSRPSSSSRSTSLANCTATGSSAAS
jgi:cytochrome d oxidase subunit CydB